MTRDMHVQRDPDTGQVQTVSGVLGKGLAWLRLLQPILTLLILPIVGYLWFHSVSHHEIEKFMSTGGRVYSSSGEPVSTDQLQKEWRSDITEAIITLTASLPPEAYKEGVQRQLDDLKVTTQTNSNKLDRIMEILLEK